MEARWVALVVMAMIGFVQSALACQVPVFRYALDHWESDRYRLEVPAGAAKDDALAAFLRNLGASSPLNLEARRGESATKARLLFPSSKEMAWEGELTPEMLAKVTDSPARRELARRILSGDSAVWVLVEPEKKADDVAQRVERRLRLLEQVAELPRIDPNDPDSQLGAGPALKLHFSLLRVAANDPAEAVFIRMLADPAQAKVLAPEPPMLALAFGRGRILRSGRAEDFGDAEIEEASLFLLGACSCRVKRENPGWDLLMPVKWEESLAQAAAHGGDVTTLEKATPADRTKPAATRPAATPEIVVIEPVSNTTVETTSRTSHIVRAALVGGGVAFLASVLLILIRFIR